MLSLKKRLIDMSTESTTQHPFLVVVEVHDLLGPCPVFKKGDKIVIDEPNILLSETDAICTRSLPMLTTFFVNLAETGRPSDPNTRPFLLRCQEIGQPNGPVVFELKTLPRTEGTLND